MRARSVDSLSRALGDEIQRRIKSEEDRRTLMVRAVLAEQWKVAMTLITWVDHYGALHRRPLGHIGEYGSARLAALPSPAEAVREMLGEVKPCP
jgi:hypothetical protein